MQADIDMQTAHLHVGGHQIQADIDMQTARLHVGEYQLQARYQHAKKSVF